MFLIEFLRHEWQDHGDDANSPTKDVSSLARLRTEFRRMDLDGDGRISRQEFASVAERIWEEQHRHSKRKEGPSGTKHL